MQIVCHVHLSQEMSKRAYENTFVITDHFSYVILKRNQTTMLMARVLMDNIHRIHCIFACISAIKHKLILKKKLITDKIARVDGYSSTQFDNIPKQLPRMVSLPGIGGFSQTKRSMIRIYHKLGKAGFDGSAKRNTYRPDYCCL